MDVKNIGDRREGSGDKGVFPGSAPNIRILLIDHDTNSLLSHASKLEQHLYKVSAAESTEVALSLLQARKNYFNMVIADLELPEGGIFVVVDKCRQMNIPLILMARDGTVEMAMKVLNHGPCYLATKPLGQYTVDNLWQHIVRVTGELPTSLTETAFVGQDEQGDSSSRVSGDGGGSSPKQGNSKRKSNSAFGIKDADGCNSGNLRMTWTHKLHAKFLQALDVLGEKRPKPETLLRMMNDPSLTLDDISAHLREYQRDQKARSVNLQEIGGPVVPSLQPAAPKSISLRGQTSGTANFNSVAARFAPNIPRSPSLPNPPNSVAARFAPNIPRSPSLPNPPNSVAARFAPEIPRSPTLPNPPTSVSNFAGYTLSYVKERLDAWNNERARANNGFQAPSEEPKGATRGSEE
ncbi:two-component response regulator ARR14-like [Daucus carota subsp. sativus]|uniref:two-component response regulator ARR14-like n=1 Tax=Daucus carota subsp. sativus TaxID=79200 RepID=UPI0030832485